MASVETITPAPGLTHARAPAYAWYALALLVAVCILNFIDRKLPFVLIESIRKDLRLSDSQIGLMAGLAFSLVYATAGLAISRLADRFSRKWIIAIALLLWTAATACGGLTHSFLALVSTRVGLALGEAAFLPSATSLISDYFPEQQRRVALGVLFAGSVMAALIGLPLGGWINDALGWRAALELMIVPGVILGILIATTVREPSRGAKEESTSTLARDSGGSAWKAVIALLSSKRSFRHLLAAASLYIFYATTITYFTPAYVMRRFHFSASLTGLTVGLAVGSSGIVGMIVGGAVTDRLAARDVRWNMRLPAITVAMGRHSPRLKPLLAWATGPWPSDVWRSRCTG
jgi:predicted MFS family arabinose efflux permease